jgi:hypothetical protein
MFALGIASGTLIGLLVPLILCGWEHWAGRTVSFVPPEAIPFFAAGGALGAANGGVGTWAGWRWGSRPVGRLLWIPLLPPLYPLAIILQGGPDSKGAGAELVAFGLLGVFVWVAGRIGQDLGAATAA